MPKPSPDQLVQTLLERHGRTFAQELRIPIADNTPSSLFQLLCAALLFSARIRASVAVQAARALFDQGWTTPEKMAAAAWVDRTRTLNRSGYARYDERTSTMLGQTSELLLERYRGDLRNLRGKARRQPDRERQLLKDFKGIGDVGVDIFFREVQAAWDELFPFADRRALQGAEALGLPADPQSLAKLVEPGAFPQLVAALVRAQLAGKDELRRLAEGNGT